MTEIVYATAEMMRGFKVPQRTSRAIAIVEGDEVCAIGGLYPDRGSWVVFSEMSEGFRKNIMKHRRVLLRAARCLLAIAAKREMAVTALADPDIAGSSRLLEHLGFEHAHSGVWVWQTH